MSIKATSLGNDKETTVKKSSPSAKRPAARVPVDRLQKHLDGASQRLAQPPHALFNLSDIRRRKT